MNCPIQCHVIQLSPDHQSGVLEAEDGATLPFLVAERQDAARELAVGDRAWVTEEDAFHAPRELTFPHHRTMFRIRLEQSGA